MPPCKNILVKIVNKEDFLKLIELSFEKSCEGLKPYSKINDILIFSSNPI